MDIEKIKLEVFRIFMDTSLLYENMKECVNFAIALLENEIVTDNICILAGLNENEYYDIKKYFLKVLNNLGIEIDVYDKNLALRYLEKIAGDVLNNRKHPCVAVMELARYNREIFDGDSVYSIYSELDEIISLIIYDNISIITPAINKDNLEGYIRHHFKLVLKIRDMDLPANIYEQAYCKRCKYRIIPEIKLNPSGTYYERKCPKCGHGEFFWIRHNNGMDLYLNEIISYK